MKNTLLHWLGHYVYGLFAQTFNGVVTTAVVLINDGVTGKLSTGITWSSVWHPLVISMVSFALIYFKGHPFPDDLSTIEGNGGTTATVAAKLNKAADV